MNKRRPGEVRDAIVSVLSERPYGASVTEIEAGVVQLIGNTPSSSIRSYLRLNTPELFARTDRAQYVLNDLFDAEPIRVLNRESSSKKVKSFAYGNATLFLSDCLDWLDERESKSIHAVVTDPPYGLFEYSDEQKTKLRNGKGGVWRIPP